MHTRPNEITSRPKGSRRAFPKHRETVLNIIRVSQKVPSFPLVRTMRLGELSAVRKASNPRIAWSTLFAKAYGLVCQRNPELRELFVKYPTKYLYLHPNSVASLSVHRQDEEGNQRLIWGRWNSPESSTLLELQEKLDAFCNAPIGEVFGEGLWLERMPSPLRQFVWWWVTNWSGRQRAKRIGTFSISSVGGQGALNAHHPLITTSSLAFGPVDENGNCEVVLLCDHRTLDGVMGAKALQELEKTLAGQLVDELRSIAPRIASEAA